MPAQQSNMCDDNQPWLAAYALGEADDEAALHAHLLVCPQCQRKLHEYRLVAGMLPYSAPEALPSPQLRERVIAAIERQAAELAPVGDTALATSAQPPVAEATAAAPPPPRALRRPARPRRARSFWAALALAGLAVALLAWNLTLQRELAQQQAQLAFHRQSWQTMIALLDNPSLRWYAVAGEPSAAAASGHFWAVPRGEVACLVAQNLPALREGQIYQVWLVRHGEQTSGGTFEAHGGNAWVIVRADEPLADYTAVLVTVEPSGGSTWPNGPHVMSGTLTAARVPGSADRQELLSLLGSAWPRSN
jgi:anti-sigma-K factor RskA